MVGLIYAQKLAEIFLKSIILMLEELLKMEKGMR